MICVAAPLSPQMGSLFVTGAGVDEPEPGLLLFPPQPGNVPSNVAPAVAPANAMKLRRCGDRGASWCASVRVMRIASPALLLRPPLNCVVTIVSLDLCPSG